MRPDALLFDLDGTLVDGAAAIHDSFEFALRARGHAAIPRHLVASRIGLPLRLMFRDLAGTDDAEASELVREYRARFEVVAGTLVRPTPGALAALDAFPDTPMAVVTTKAAEPARTVLRALGIEGRFAVVIGIDSVRTPKPDPEGARLALAQMGLGSAHAVFIGDTIMDVLAGKGAGTRTIAVLCGHGDESELRAARPDATIKDLTELAATVRAL